MKTLHLAIIVIVFLVFSGINFVFAQKTAAIALVFLSPDKEIYFPGDSVFIHGQDNMNVTSVTIGLEKDHKVMVSSEDSQVLKNGTFYANFTLPRDSDAKYWSLVSGPLHQDLYFKPVYVSPLEQFREGIEPSKTRCEGSLDLVISHDNLPACVKPDTAQKLVERGWALETNNPKLTYMNIKVFSSYTPDSLADHFLTGSLYSSAESIQNGNITITVNGATMGTTQTYPNGCFQFNNWNDSKLIDQINKSKSLGMSSMELNFQTRYFGDSNHNPANASAISYLNFYAVPLAPTQYDTGVYPSDQINMTQGNSAQFHITVKPFFKYWEVGHMKLNLQRMPCGISYHISPVDNNDSVLVNNTV